MRKKFFILSVLILSCAMLLSACGSSDSYSGSVRSMAGGAGGAYYESAMYDEAFVSNDYDYKSGSASAISESRKNVKLIYTGNVSLETTEFDVVRSRIDEIADECGAYYESDSIRSYSDSELFSNTTYRHLNITVRVPAGNFDKFMELLREQGNVLMTRCDVNTEDVSEQYYDIEMRLRLARAEVDELNELLAVADDLDDVLAIRNELQNAVYKVESLQGRLNSFDSRIDYSYIYLNLDEVTAVTMASHLASYESRLAESFKDGLYGGLNFIGNLLLWFASNWLVLCILIAVIVLIVHARRARKQRRLLDGTADVRKVKSHKLFRKNSDFDVKVYETKNKNIANDMISDSGSELKKTEDDLIK